MCLAAPELTPFIIIAGVAIGGAICYENRDEILNFANRAKTYCATNAINIGNYVYTSGNTMAVQMSTDVRDVISNVLYDIKANPVISANVTTLPLTSDLVGMAWNNISIPQPDFYILSSSGQKYFASTASSDVITSLSIRANGSDLCIDGTSTSWTSKITFLAGFSATGGYSICIGNNYTLPYQQDISADLTKVPNTVQDIDNQYTQYPTSDVLALNPNANLQGADVIPTLGDTSGVTGKTVVENPDGSISIPNTTDVPETAVDNPDTSVNDNTGTKAFDIPIIGEILKILWNIFQFIKSIPALISAIPTAIIQGIKDLFIPKENISDVKDIIVNKLNLPQLNFDHSFADQPLDILIPIGPSYKQEVKLDNSYFKTFRVVMCGFMYLIFGVFIYKKVTGGITDDN